MQAKAEAAIYSQTEVIKMTFVAWGLVFAGLLIMIAVMFAAIHETVRALREIRDRLSVIERNGRPK